MRFVYAVELSSKSSSGGWNYRIEMYDTKEDYHITSEKLNTASHRGFENEAERLAVKIFKAKNFRASSYLLGIFKSTTKINNGAKL